MEDGTQPDTVLNIFDHGLAAEREPTNMYTELLPSGERSNTTSASGYTAPSEQLVHVPILSSRRRHGGRSSSTSSYLSYIRRSWRPMLTSRHLSRRRRDERYRGPRNNSESSSSSSRGHRRSNSRRQNNRTLKMLFIAVCVLNMFLLLVVTLTNPTLCVFSCNDDYDDELNTNFKLCTKCQPLEAKVGSAGGLIDEIRSSEYPDFCCFHRVDQILSLFDGYAHRYVDQEVFSVRKELQNTGNIIASGSHNADFRRGSMAHLYYSRHNTIPAVLGGLYPLTWETRGTDIILGQDMKVNEMSHLEVLDSGYYYVYSHLTVKSGRQMAHQIFRNYNTSGRYKLLYRTHSEVDTSMSSELVGVIMLKESETLSVVAKRDCLAYGERKNYFGAFKISD